MSKKNIVLLSYLDYPYYVGLSRRISGISRVLTANGIAVKVIAPLARSSVPLSDGFSHQIEVKRIDLNRLGHGRAYPSKLLQWLLFSIIASVYVIRDVIKKHSVIQYQSIYSALPAILAKVTVNATILGDDYVLTYPIIDKVILKLTDSVSTPSKGAYLYAKQLGKPSLYVPNGVEKTPANICSNDITRKPSSLIFVGALTFDQNYKAIEHILTLAEGLDRAGVTFTVSIVGGPLSLANEFMKHTAVQKGLVKFLGSVSYEALDRLYASASVGLLPFFDDIPLYGGQRTKALEFFANGLLVISGPEGIKGITGIHTGQHYLLAKSVNEMKDWILDSIDRPEKYANISIAGASYVLEKHSWEYLAEAYTDYILSFFTGKQIN